MKKRLFDLIFGLIAIMITIPFFILIAIAIKLESQGSIFFIQNRTGLNGEIFKMYKFRSMIADADKIGHSLTQINDTRITKVGKFLRRFSLDEIPQLINVINGEMSIVGPRPEIVQITDTYKDEQRKVLEFKPGLTGISQINGRAALDIDRKIKIDVEYYKNSNLIKDIMIIIKTPFVVFTNKGNIM